MPHHRSRRCASPRRSFSIGRVSATPQTTRSRVAREFPDEVEAACQTARHEVHRQTRRPGGKRRLRAHVPDRPRALPRPTEAQLEQRRPGYLSSRSFAAYEGKEIVGTAAAWPFDMVVPGGGRIATAGVTACRRDADAHASRHPHEPHALAARRRGRDRPAGRDPRRDREHHLRPIRLWPRHDCGRLTIETNTVVRPSRSRIRVAFGSSRVPRRCDMFPGRLRTARPRSARVRSTGRRVRWAHPRMYGPIPEGDPTPPEIYVLHEDAERQARRGMAYEILDRDSWWEQARLRRGARPVRLARRRTSRSGATSLDLDLRKGVKFHMRTPDEALRWMLADPRRLEMKLEDQLWLRVLDVPTALAARTYGRAGQLVLDVADPFLGLGGRFEIDSARRVRPRASRVRRPPTSR